MNFILDGGEIILLCGEYDSSNHRRTHTLHVGYKENPRFLSWGFLSTAEGERRQATATFLFLRLRQPKTPSTPRPPANSGRAAGTGTGARSDTWKCFNSLKP